MITAVKLHGAEGLSIISPPSLAGLVNHSHGRQVFASANTKNGTGQKKMPDLAGDDKIGVAALSETLAYRAMPLLA